MAIREAIVEQVKLLSSPSKQLEYEKNVPIAAVPAELVCGFEGLFHPKDEEFLTAFTSDEIRNLAYLYGLVCEAARLEASETVELNKSSEWKRVIALAKELSAYFEHHV